MARLIDADEILRELKNCRNELCLKCGEYTSEHLGNCDGCRYNRQSMAKWENMPSVDAGVLKDDNSQIVAAHDGSRVDLDREQPRVEIEIRPLVGEKTGGILPI